MGFIAIGPAAGALVDLHGQHVVLLGLGIGMVIGVVAIAPFGLGPALGVGEHPWVLLLTVVAKNFSRNGKPNPVAEHQINRMNASTVDTSIIVIENHLTLIFMSFSLC